MILYFVTKKVNEEDEDKLKASVTQKDAYDHLKSIDPEGAEQFAIYPLEV